MTVEELEVLIAAKRRLDALERAIEACKTRAVVDWLTAVYHLAAEFEKERGK